MSRVSAGRALIRYYLETPGFRRRADPSIGGRRTPADTGSFGVCYQPRRLPAAVADATSMAKAMRRGVMTRILGILPYRGLTATGI